MLWRSCARIVVTQLNPLGFQRDTLMQKPGNKLGRGFICVNNNRYNDLYIQGA